MTTPTNLEGALDFARANRTRTEHGLAELLSIPSISTYSENKPDMDRAADWIVSRLAGMGFEARRIPSGGPDAVFAQRRSNTAEAQTLLIYGHYDVQPDEPLEEWSSPPFAPVVRGDNLFGRGSSDMKGPLVATMTAVEAALAAGDLPIHIKFFLEGEEEIGSPNMESFLRANRSLLTCDAVLNPDTMLVSPDQPALVYGLRGLAYFELRVETAGHDLHSGVFGGAVPNAGQALCELIAGMHDDRGQVTLPGFYDDVLELDPVERAELARIPYEKAEFLSQATAYGVNGEEGYTVTERLGARPTLEVNGLLCGFTGEGSKTVLPARAMAKISMRLVPNQADGKVQSQLEEYLRLHAPAWLKWEVLEMAGGPAALVRRDTPAMLAAIRALEAAFGARPVFIREGGSVPVVSLMQDILGRESILMGVSLPDDNLHAPNEKLHLPTFHRGVEAYIRLLYELAE